MKIIVIGSKGSTGKRYCKILRDIGVEVYEYDIDNKDEQLPFCDRAIIASPTITHYHYAMILQSMDIPYLCEKPACDDIGSLKFMFGKMVCNWAFVFEYRILKPGKHKVLYENNYTGNEGYWFDTCQLHILSGRGSFIDEAFPGNGFVTFIDNEHVTIEMIEESYRTMIQVWLHTPEKIWNIQDLIPELSYIIRKHEIEVQNG